MPADTWYIFPIKSIPNQPKILLSPHSEKSKHAKYKEAWHLLNG
jgi:hypothetical protein